MHEAQMHKENDFITLTYAPEHVPNPATLIYRHFQLFMRRTRKALKPKKIRFYMAGEYGEQNGRPHFHAIIFGHSFTGKSPLGKSAKGFTLWHSQQLAQLWPFGHVSTGEVNFDTAAYVARYVMKKVTGDLATEHYTKTDPGTGEIYLQQPELSRMSLRPGLGKNWLLKYANDVYPEGKIIANGQQANAPKYYDKLYEQMNPEVIENLKYEREKKGKENFDDNTDARLAVKEIVAKAKVKTKGKQL